LCFGWGGGGGGGGGGGAGAGQAERCEACRQAERWVRGSQLCSRQQSAGPEPLTPPPLPAELPSLMRPPPPPPSPLPPCLLRRYGDGTVRLTVEENVVLPNVPEANLAALQAEPIFQRLPIHGGGCCAVGCSAVGAGQSGALLRVLTGSLCGGSGVGTLCDVRGVHLPLLQPPAVPACLPATFPHHRGPSLPPCAAAPTLGCRQPAARPGVVHGLAVLPPGPGGDQEPRAAGGAQAGGAAGHPLHGPHALDRLPQLLRPGARGRGAVELWAARCGGWVGEWVGVAVSDVAAAR
jgi:hypothetical protein